MAEDSSVALPLPADMRFLNVDRGMNLYLSSNVAGETAFDVWRANPDGTLAGGAHIETDCALSWRRIYVDQGGDAWTLCAGTNGVTVTKYPLLDSAGQALAAPTGDPPAEVRWRPGTKFDAA